MVSILKVSIQYTKNDSFLIKSVGRQYCIDCINRLERIDVPFTTNLNIEKFSCKLIYWVDPFDSAQMIVKLTDLTMKSVYAIDVVLYDTSPSKEMVFQNNEWKATLDMKKKVCTNCVFNRQSFGLVNRKKAQYHFPGHNLYIHRKPQPNEGQSIIVNHIVSLLENEAFADVHFDVTGARLPAHTLIVSAGSPVLAAMFQNDFEERSTGIVNIKDTSVETFRQFLRYLYTGNMPECKEDATVADLFGMADKYGVDSLKEECAVCLAEQLDVENAVDTLIKAYLHSSTTLYEETMSFVSRNASAICSQPSWLILMKEYPDLCFEATQFISLK